MKNKTILITGATKGLGLASAKALLEQGARVIMVYRSDQKNAADVTDQLQKFKSQMLVLQADITQQNHRATVIKKALDAFGRIDVLINNAGVAAKAGFLKETPEEYATVIAVNLTAPIFLAQAVAQQIIKQGDGGSIINIASVSGHRGFGGISYDAAKAGLIRATQTTANALGKHHIRANSISPGTHLTEMNRYHWENNTTLFQNMTAVTALNRAAAADEIAGTIIYLASEQSSFTTGSDIIVDGGYLIHGPGRKPGANVDA
jgi:L-rhamnose 1-dehydrogenase